jgi:hypothetical protein
MPVIPELSRLRQEDEEFVSNMDYTRPCLQKGGKKKKKGKTKMNLTQNLYSSFYSASCSLPKSLTSSLYTPINYHHGLYFILAFIKLKGKYQTVLDGRAAHTNPLQNCTEHWGPI